MTELKEFKSISDKFSWAAKSEIAYGSLILDLHPKLWPTPFLEPCICVSFNYGYYRISRSDEGINDYYPSDPNAYIETYYSKDKALAEWEKMLSVLDVVYKELYTEVKRVESDEQI